MRFPILLAATAATALTALAACQSAAPVTGLPPKDRYFVEHVKPVLERNCLRCHNGVTLPARLNLTGPNPAFAARKHGRPYIIPGKPDDSLLVTAISRKGTHPLLMPRLTLSLTDDQIGILREWIEDGAAWPAGPQGRLAAAPNPENP